MLKVLLVDDEPFILEGLKLLIDWEQEGYEITGTAVNGLEALEFLKKDHCGHQDAADDRTGTFGENSKRSVIGCLFCRFEWICGIRVCAAGNAEWVYRLYFKTGGSGNITEGVK